MTKTDESDIAVEYFNVGNAFYEIDQFGKAIEYYDKVLKIDPDFHKARYNLVYIYVSREDFKTANKHINYLYITGDDNLRIKKLSAYIKYSEGKLDDSLGLYLDVLDSGDNSDDIRFNIVKLYFQLEDYENALDYVKELILGKEDVDLYYMAGLIADNARDLDLAIDYYETCIELGGKEKDLLGNVLDIYLELSDFENQKKILGLIAQSSDGDVKANALFDLSKISLITDNDFSQGYGYLESAIEAGFKNIQKVNELLDIPDLIEKDKIRLLFTDKEILK